MIKFVCLTEEALNDLHRNLAVYKIPHVWLGDAVVAQNTHRLWSGDKLYIGHEATIQVQYISDYDIERLQESL